jgi:hypothetical protein
LKEGCLFVLFVMLRSLKPCYFLLHSWYQWKVFYMSRRARK